jgi:hypothetical protein
MIEVRRQQESWVKAFVWLGLFASASATTSAPTATSASTAATTSASASPTILLILLWFLCTIHGILYVVHCFMQLCQ